MTDKDEDITFSMFVEFLYMYWKMELTPVEVSHCTFRREATSTTSNARPAFKAVLLKTICWKNMKRIHKANWGNYMYVHFLTS